MGPNCWHRFTAITSRNPQNNFQIFLPPCLGDMRATILVRNIQNLDQEYFGLILVKVWSFDYALFGEDLTMVLVILAKGWSHWSHRQPCG